MGSSGTYQAARDVKSFAHQAHTAHTPGSLTLQPFLPAPPLAKMTRTWVGTGQAASARYDAWSAYARAPWLSYPSGESAGHGIVKRRGEEDPQELP